MKELTMESKEFKRVLHNLRLENIRISVKVQKKIIEHVNQKKEISPTLIKKMVAYDKI